MNKDAIIRRLKALPYDPKEYWVMGETARVMRGMVQGAGSILLGCTKKLADQLEKEGVSWLGDPNPGGQYRKFKPAEDLAFMEYFLDDVTDLVDGFRVLNEEGMEFQAWMEMRSYGLNPEIMKEMAAGHFVYHYPEGSLAEKELDTIMKSREKAFRLICDMLKVEPDFPIHYYFVDSPAEVKRAVPGVNFSYNAIVRPESSFAVYNEQMRAVGFQELVFLISALFGDPESTAIRTGLAQVFENGWGPADDLTWTVFFRKTRRLVRIADLLNNDNFTRINYYIVFLEMGAFTKWLIGTFGMDKYKEFYGYKDSREGFRKVYGKEVAEIDRMFLEYTLHYDISEEAEKGMEKIIRQVLVTGKTQ